MREHRIALAAERRERHEKPRCGAAHQNGNFCIASYLVESRLGRGALDGVAKELADVIKSSGDARLRGVAHNLLGDYYQKVNQQDEAFWHYLRVDAMYPDDAEEHAKALYHLALLFDKVKKDPVRGKECAARLMEPRLAGTSYQRRWAAQSKKTP